ncbi:hypothetical protein A0J61_07471 [Choanephora cucurbitarum]|uniref:Uncharacterized protein n=1 Tax=Choanephora cucurbitarum TaxID=101091 RepID=A0A1C7N787_9FUNG|nr:hypothetical protein A0J61_07471 [Choanephora cucurbitarum]
MSSVSSFEGSDQRSFIEGSSSSLRHSYLRKTDLLDTFEVGRLRDTDTWSVAATIDDQESVISTHGGPPSIISSSRMTVDRETDDDRSTLDGESSLREHLHDMHLNDNNTNLRDLVENKHLLRSVGGSILDDEDDKRSRSNAAEFGDDGARSATADFDHSVESGEEDNVVDDEIVAPPQPQPSFASITKSYAELMEENEILQTQLRNAQLAQKHQADMISHLKNLTGCNDEVYGKALDLSHLSKDELYSNQNTKSTKTSQETNTTNSTDNSNGNNNNSSNNGGGDGSEKSEKESYVSLPQDQAQASPIVNARTLTQKLARLAETLTRFVHATVDEEWRLTLEQSLFLQITQLYLSSLPFGTENQDLLNTAYSDQIRRFHSTLGANFAKWYRRQTVQSLSLNPATKEYLHDMRNHLTDEMLRLLTTMTKRDKVPVEHMHMWDDILELCAALSLEIHGGDADVTAQIIGVGSKFDEEIMALVGDSTATKDRRVGMVISPLFVDEEEVVLLPARVVLEQ